MKKKLLELKERVNDMSETQLEQRVGELNKAFLHGHATFYEVAEAQFIAMKLTEE